LWTGTGRRTKVNIEQGIEKRRTRIMKINTRDRIPQGQEKRRTGRRGHGKRKILWKSERLRKRTRKRRGQEGHVKRR